MTSLPFAARLRPGTNIIAVILHNVWQPDWDDVAFDLRLQTVPDRAQPAGALALEPEFDAGRKLQAVNVRIRVRPDTNWRLETTDSLAGSSWELWQRISASSATQELTLRDNSPGNTLDATRFFRLVPDDTATGGE